ncbi:ketoreductase [Verticillium dahliae]|nr:ketoreductase [Verticillium dahliae]
MVKVLLTGGSGFIGGHILEQLLEQGHDAVVTVRSEDKAQKIRDDYKDLAAGRLTVAIVPDIAREDAFDEVVKSPGLEAVLHTASPFHFNFTDPKKDLIDPAVIGTTAILQALHRSAPGVKRVVITSSARTWDFVAAAAPAPTFDLVTSPPLVLGPVGAHLASLDAINPSNERLVPAAARDWKARVADTGAAAPAAAGRRLFTTAGWFSTARSRPSCARTFPELADRLPGPEILGIQWIGLEKSIVDSVKQLQSLPVWKTL